jgi:hypothetical protein
MSEHDSETSTMKPMTTELIFELERNPLVVSFQDGKIEELCLSKPESDKILNIKRGILSLIQNNMDDINKDQTVTEVSLKPIPYFLLYRMASYIGDVLSVIYFDFQEKHVDQLKSEKVHTYSNIQHKH